MGITAKQARAMTPAPKLERYTSSSDWSALYVNGQLATYGDHYIIDEWIAEYVGIINENSDSFLLGTSGGRNGKIAQTTAEIEAYDRMRDEAKLKLRALHAEAKKISETFGLPNIGSDSYEIHNH